MKNSKTYHQGRSFPPSAHGAGLIFLLMAFFLVFGVKLSYWFLSLGYISFWIIFSTTTLDMTQISQGIIIKRFGLFPFRFKSRLILADYDAGVIKQVNVKYRTTQSTGFFVLSSQDNKESFMALQLKIKGKYEFETLFKGNRREILDFIKANLNQSGLKFYNGIPKAEYEINVAE